MTGRHSSVGSRMKKAGVVFLVRRLVPYIEPECLENDLYIAINGRVSETTASYTLKLENGGETLEWGATTGVVSIRASFPFLGSLPLPANISTYTFFASSTGSSSSFDSKFSSASSGPLLDDDGSVSIELAVSSLIFVISRTGGDTSKAGSVVEDGAESTSICISSVKDSTRFEGLEQLIDKSRMQIHNWVTRRWTPSAWTAEFQPSKPPNEQTQGSQSGSSTELCYSYELHQYHGLQVES